MPDTELTPSPLPQALASATPDQGISTPCPACGRLRHDNYCAHCGQRRVARLQTRNVLEQTFNAMLSLEGPWLRTIKELLLRPSALILAYHAGARHRYVNPVLLVIVSYTFFFVLCHWLGIDPFASTLGDSSIDAQVLKFITDYSGQLSVVMAYPTAMLMRRVWPETTTAERYVALLYAQSLSGFAGLLVVLVAVFSGSYDNNLSFLISSLATLYAYAGVHPSRWRSLLIGLVASVSYLLVVLAIAFVVGFVAAVFLSIGQ